MNEPKKFRRFGPIGVSEVDLWLVPSSLLGIVDKIIIILTLGIIVPDLELRFLFWNLERQTYKKTKVN